MIPRECKRLIEVDFPIAAVSAHSAREKSIHYGHPSTLHLWWARRPLAACRAVLMGLLLPDPADPHCPKAFNEEARRLLAGIEGQGPKSDLDLRRALLDFIAEFSDWDNSAREHYLTRARALVHAAHPEEIPLVADPFAGGGSIPLEALRIGCEAFASDLNQVACLILKVMLEDIPRHRPKLAEELRWVGAEINAAAEREMAEFYPADPDGARPIAYLWARTVRCESPNCGAEIPLVRSFWLSKKPGRRRALRWEVERLKKSPPDVLFYIFEPKEDEEVPKRTVTRARATCPACGAVLLPERVRAQLAGRRGGANVEFNARGQRVGGARLLAVVTLRQGEVGRGYRLPTQRDYEAVWNAVRRLREITKERLPGGLSSVPDEPLPWRHSHRSVTSPRAYGMEVWGDMFTQRQKVSLILLQQAIRKSQKPNGDTNSLLACALDRVVMSNMSCTRWNSVAEKMQHTFGRQALPMVWDFAEVVPIAQAPGNWQSGYELVADVVELWPTGSVLGQVQAADATESPLPDSSCAIWFTDPPYWDNVPYSDLSDFFFVWLKRGLADQNLTRNQFEPQSLLTPKIRELTVTTAPGEKLPRKTGAFFVEGMARAFSEGRRVLSESGIGCVVFAHKTTEGWESLLTGMVSGGWILTGSWPLTTEMASRLVARDTASLTASVHLICRPRPMDAPVGGWEEIIRELPGRISDWVERLSKEGIRGADLVFSCIGPAMELYSRHPLVETADGREVKLDEFMAKVWEVLGQTALRRVLGGQGNAEDATGALEEDARLTALFLWTLQSKATSGNGEPKVEEDDQEVETVDDEEEVPRDRIRSSYSLPFDIVRRFAQPLGIHLEDWEGRVIETEKGTVRLLPISARAARLFGGETAEAVAAGAQQLRRGPVQAKLFPESEPTKGTTEEGRRTKKLGKIPVPSEITTLDRVHTAMLLQTAGQSGGLREFLKDEIHRGPQFLRLANALSALYPKDSEEKRLLDAVLLAVPRR